MRLPVLVLLFGFLPLGVSAKSRQGGPITASAATLSFYKANIDPVVQSLQNGNSTIVDPNCQSPSVVTSNDLVVATIAGKNFYIVLNPISVNGVNYGVSNCQRTVLANNAIEIDCAASELNPSVPPGATLSFEFEYIQTAQNPNRYTVFKCPQAAQ